MSVAVVIPSYNGVDLLQHYLPYLLSCVPAASVTVIDDASTDDSVAYLRQEFPDIRAIQRSANGGFSRAVNDGIRATNGEFLVLLNNDVEVTPGFLDTILLLFEEKSVFAVSPRIVLPKHDGVDEGCKSGFWHHGMFYADQKQGVTDVCPTLYACGCAAVYRRSMLEELGGFDEAYSPFYWEDTDLGYRAWKRGWKSLYQPASTVYHQHASSVSRLKRSNTDRIKSRNGLLFLWRNIEDTRLMRLHRLWLPAVLLKRMTPGNSAFLAGFRSALAVRHEANLARMLDSSNRVLSDREIFAAIGVDVPK
ncbi:MAG: glycosyltransferase family 2 protein [Armatimonadota bacterium]